MPTQLELMQQRSRQVSNAIKKEGEQMNLERNIGNGPIYTLNFNENNIEQTKKYALRLEELARLIKKYPKSNQIEEWLSEIQEINKHMMNSFRTPNEMELNGGAKKRRQTRRHRRRSQYRRRR
jgi:ribosome-binding ATPase YchF (GTP1/OBG family)